jgi:hypothetical protein
MWAPLHGYSPKRFLRRNRPGARLQSHRLAATAAPNLASPPFERALLAELENHIENPPSRPALMLDGDLILAQAQGRQSPFD